jgi:hypothetical protein
MQAASIYSLHYHEGEGIMQAENCGISLQQA